MASQSAIVPPEPDFEHAPAYGRPMSIEQWEAMDEDEPGELVDGLLVEEEVPDNLHEAIVSILIRLLWGWLLPRKGLVLASEAKFVLNERRGRKPDISVFVDPQPRRRGANRVPPDIMVEVVSRRPRDRRRDRVQKFHEYAAFGVRWYWLVDAEAQTLEIYRLHDGHYNLALNVGDGAVEVPGCEGLTLDLDALWRELDERLPPEESPQSG
jgi:Uma2 family endonuclease